MPEYPEHEKLQKVAELTQTCGEFLDYLEANGYSLCEVGQYDRFYPTFTPKVELIARFFEIDRDKIEAEKREMLERIRA